MFVRRGLVQWFIFHFLCNSALVMVPWYIGLAECTRMITCNQNHLWRQTELLYSPARRMLLYCCYCTSPPRPSPFGSFNVIQWGKHSQHPSQPANTIMTRNFIISVQPWRQSRPTIMGQWLWWNKIIGKITEYLTWKLAELATVYNNIKLSKFSQPFNIK